MTFDAVLERFAARSPTTVVAKLLLDRALDPAWVDTIFEAHRERQYTRDLLFSTTVDLMSTVALGLQPSIHAAAQVEGNLPVSLAALYAKINGIEPTLVRELVRGSAKRLVPVQKALGAKTETLLSGYRVRIVDGNHLPASEKRLAVLRSFRGAARPGHSLVVYEPELGLVTDIVPCEDAYAQERSLMPFLLAESSPGELWIADRNFSTTAIFRGFAKTGACFLIREHGSSPNPTECGRLRKMGRVETGMVYEQAVELTATKEVEALPLRRIEIHLDEPMENGESVIRILTNVPAAVRAKTLANLYRRRWTIESMFQWLESVLNSEVRTLGYPRAALFAFGVALVAFNALSLIRQAIEVAHESPPDDPQGVSFYYVSNEISSTITGLCIAVPDETWEPLRRLAPGKLGKLLLELAGRVDPRKCRKHPRSPKVAKKKGYVSGREARSQVSTARAIASGKVRS